MTHGVVHIGLYVVFGIILLPVYVMLLGWFVGKPAFYRSVAVAFGYMILFAASVVIGIFVLDIVLSVVA